MSSWAGFTDEELSRLRGQQNGGETDLEGFKETGRKKATINSTKKQRSREKIRSRATSGDAKVPVKKQEDKTNDLRGLRNESSTGENIAESSISRLDTREEERENSLPECERRVKTKQVVEEALPRSKTAGSLDENKVIEAGPVKVAEEIPDTSIVLPEIIDEEEKIQAIEQSALEKMQEKQKQMEEENKRKKAALQETIKKRYQRTQAEAQMLSLVQKELSHLDSLLSADVAILRDKIEESSRDYLHAQKRYERAEQEFIAAKLDLHNKTERKDLLTEHLYTIIRENELRKAKKLEELMAKVNTSANNTAVLKQSCSAPNNNDNKSSISQTMVLQEEKTPITQNCDGNEELHIAHDSALADKIASEETKTDVMNTAANKLTIEAVAEAPVRN